MYIFAKNNGKKHHWWCKDRKLKCKGHVVSLGAHYDDVTSVVVRATEHNHPPSAVNVKLYDAIDSLRHQAMDTDLTGMQLRQQLLRTVDPEVAKILPTVTNMSRFIRYWRAKKREKVAAAKQ